MKIYLKWGIIAVVAYIAWRYLANLMATSKSGGQIIGGSVPSIAPNWPRPGVYAPTTTSEAATATLMSPLIRSTPVRGRQSTTRIQSVVGAY